MTPRTNRPPALGPAEVAGAPELKVRPNDVVLGTGLFVQRRCWNAIAHPPRLSHGFTHTSIGGIAAESNESVTVRALRLIPLFDLACSFTKGQTAAGAMNFDLGFHTDRLMAQNRKLIEKSAAAGRSVVLRLGLGPDGVTPPVRAG